MKLKFTFNFMFISFFIKIISKHVIFLSLQRLKFIELREKNKEQRTKNKEQRTKNKE